MDMPAQNSETGTRPKGPGKKAQKSGKGGTILDGKPTAGTKLDGKGGGSGKAAADGQTPKCRRR